MIHTKAWFHAGDLINTLLQVRCAASEEAAGNLNLLADFARDQTIPGLPADFARALTVLKVDSETVVSAELHVARDIAALPPIQRTGVSTPTMDGLQLGFDTDRIDDPIYQRSGSLFFTKAARFQALCNLLSSFLSVWPADSVPQYPLRARAALGKEKSASLEQKLTSLLRAKSAAERHELVCKLLQPPAERALLPESLKGALTRPRTATVPEHLSDAQKNALSALYLQFRSHLDEERHLGVRRLRKWDRNDVSNVVIQGAGDLSMNPWNVALYRDVNDEPRILIPPNEPFGTRHYHCLLGLKPGVSRVMSDYCTAAHCKTGNLAILPLRFSPGAIAMVDPGAAFDLKTEVSFALYGKLIIRDGRVVDAVEVVDEFLDLRHIFDLPNLNPESVERLDEAFHALRPHLDAASSERLWVWMKDRPRPLFGQMQSGDVWLLEKCLLDDRNLRHLACYSSIAVPLDLLGAPKDWIALSLRAWGYEFQPRPELVGKGQFSWDLRDISRPVLHVHLRPSRYPCSAVGIGSVEHGPAGPPDCVYLLAWGHDFKHARHTIFDCARVLRAAGARWAVAIDEGHDVFQFLARDQDERRRFASLEEKGGDIAPYFRVPIVFDAKSDTRNPTLKRTGLRASLAFWQEAIAHPD